MFDHFSDRPRSPEKDRCVPDDFYSTTNHRTHVRMGGRWVEVENQRMDAVIVASVNRDVNAVLNDVEFRKPLLEGGGSIVGGSPDQWRQFLAAERRKWGPLVKKLGIKGE